MKTLQFAHISDTHLSGENCSDFVKSLLPTPWENFELALAQLAEKRLDFVIHTGDMTHEGGEVEYAKAKELFEKNLPNIPIFAAMGNHDVRSAFRKIFFSENSGDGQHLACGETNGLKIISLDTSIEKNLMGKIYENQLDFLEKSLCNTNSAIIIMHQPPVSEAATAQMEIPPRFLDLIARPQVKAIFSGHMHSSFACTFGTKPCFTAGSLSFGIEYAEKTQRYTDLLAYSICTIGDGGITAHECVVSPQTKTLQIKELSE